MDFAFSEEQDEFRAVVRRFVEERWPTAEVRRLADHAGFEPAVWKQMGAELGLQGLAIPETYGGQGFGFLEVGIALEELGRQLAGGPYLASAVLATQAILAAAGEAQRAEWLPRLAAGEMIATLAVGEPDVSSENRRIAGTVPECRRDGAGWRVTGAKTVVLDGQNADLLLLAARAGGDDGLTLLAVRPEARGVELAPADGLDLARKHAELTLRDAPAEALGAAGGAAPALARALDLGAIAIAAEAVGAAARCLEMAVAYAKQRIQFGRPIGSFQAVQHKCAEVMLELESARSAAYWSWWVASQEAVEPGALAEAASVAKATACDALTRAAAENVQIHGGVGFTWEFDCHLYFRRAKAVEHLLGDPIWHRARLADRLGL
ncbi:MAG TPA: acyl-CoA dehydrogenase family protein [Myxococcota bacterium]|nr:acyl-CoA dehydrogenase family protein [Myxococcota bacterium]